MALKVDYPSYPSFTKANAVVCAATALYYWRNQDLLTTSALTIVGNLGVEFCRRLTVEVCDIFYKKKEVEVIKKDMLEKRDSYYGEDMDLEMLEYRMCRSREFDPSKEEAVVEKALTRIKQEYPAEYIVLQNVCSIANNPSNLIEKIQRSSNNQAPNTSEKETQSYIKKELPTGCCFGISNAIFAEMVNTPSASLAESYHRIQSEDVYYHQVLQLVAGGQSEFIDQKAKILVEANCRFEGLTLEDPRKVETNESESFQDYYRKFENVCTNNCKKMSQYLQGRFKNINLSCCSTNFQASDKFSMHAESATYRDIFEKAMKDFPDSQDFVGVIHIPRHVISLQYGPRGYFLCDPYAWWEGLYEFPDSAKFFSQLRKIVLFDTKNIFGIIFKRVFPNVSSEQIVKDIQEEIEKREIYYSVRPLNHINPHYKPSELSEAGYMEQMNRKLDSYAHNIAVSIVGTKKAT